ncbi:MAG: hypothetical protein ACI87W_003424 [Halieaceae bacterium]|jgi:uncharacterized protein (UPF0276 family)
MTHIDPFSGYGLGLRRDHYQDFLEGEVPVDFVEVISENYMIDGGNPLHVLEQVRAKMPVLLHGVSLSIGSATGVDLEYLAKLKTLAERIEPLWVSDHLCWTRTSAHNSHDLLPLPYTREALDIVCDNIDLAQETLGRALLFENPSSYVTFPDDEMSEWEFIAQMARRSGCYLLLDINNVFVSAHNHSFAAEEYLAGLPMNRVRQIHLAGHTDGDIKIDTHDQPVCDGVWKLYAKARRMLGNVATMIERDDAIPPLLELLGELDMARHLAKNAQQSAAA